MQLHSGIIIVGNLKFAIIRLSTLHFPPLCLTTDSRFGRSTTEKAFSSVAVFIFYFFIFYLFIHGIFILSGHISQTGGRILDHFGRLMWSDKWLSNAPKSWGWDPLGSVISPPKMTKILKYVTRSSSTFYCEIRTVRRQLLKLKHCCIEWLVINKMLIGSTSVKLANN